MVVTKLFNQVNINDGFLHAAYLTFKYCGRLFSTGDNQMPRQDGFFIGLVKLAGPVWSFENKLKIRIETMIFLDLSVM